ncbi:MAG: 30S ribosomal protein S6 [Rhodospirillales bacterium]|jgi:small subunit ribosomal protein S6
MAYYETVIISRQDISQPQVEALTESVTQLIEGQGGKIVLSEYWGLRTFTYRIKKGRKGHYVMLHIDAPSETVQEMERQLRLNEDVVRYLTIRLDELPEGPSIMMQKSDRGRRDRDDRDDRPARSGPNNDDQSNVVSGVNS